MAVDVRHIRWGFLDLPCGVCGNDRPKLLGMRGGSAHRDGAGTLTKIVQCEECLHVYPNPMPIPTGGERELYDKDAEYFRGHDVEEKKRIGIEKLRRFELILGCRGRYLDVGCGRGEYLWAAREAGWECEGVDPSAEYIEWGLRNLQVQGHLGTLETIRFPDAHFDVVTMGSVLEHLYKPYETMKEIARVLRPSGLLQFDIPNEGSLYCKIGNLYMRALGRNWVVNLSPTFPPFHVQGFNPSSVRRLVSRAGLHVERLRVCGTVWPPTGTPSFRKQVEYWGALAVNWLGKRCGRGIHIEVWARKPSA